MVLTPTWHCIKKHISAGWCATYALLLQTLAFRRPPRFRRELQGLFSNCCHLQGLLSRPVLAFRQGIPERQPRARRLVSSCAALHACPRKRPFHTHSRRRARDAAVDETLPGRTVRPETSPACIYCTAIARSSPFKKNTSPICSPSSNTERMLVNT